MIKLVQKSHCDKEAISVIQTSADTAEDILQGSALGII